MVRADFINRFKNHINIGEKNYAVYSDAAWEVTQQPFCKQHVDHEVLKHWAGAQLTLVFIEFVKSNSLVKSFGVTRTLARVETRNWPP